MTRSPFKPGAFCLGAGNRLSFLPPMPHPDGLTSPPPGLFPRGAKSRSEPLYAVEQTFKEVGNKNADSFASEGHVSDQSSGTVVGPVAGIASDCAAGRARKFTGGPRLHPDDLPRGAGGGGLAVDQRGNVDAWKCEPQRQACYMTFLWRDANSWGRSAASNTRLKDSGCDRQETLLSGRLGL